MIAIVDYGVGNLFSLVSSFRAIGADAVISADREEIRAADRVVLPGVGAFGDAMEKLREKDMAEFVRRQATGGKPFLGICLGMQLLFDRSFEFGTHEGLGLIPGEVRSIEGVVPARLDIPHMGWNALHFTRNGEKTSLFRRLNEGDHVYFVHSYAAFDCGAALTADTEYGARLTAAVQKDNIYGVQFHPEKSGSVGLEILKTFAEL